MTRARTSIMTRSRTSVMTRARTSIMTRTRTSIMTRARTSIMTRARTSIMTRARTSIMTRARTSIMTRARASIMTWKCQGQAGSYLNSMFPYRVWLMEGRNKELSRQIIFLFLSGPTGQRSGSLGRRRGSYLHPYHVRWCTLNLREQE